MAAKNGMTFTVNQNLPDGWGGFYLSGRISDYWNRSGTEKQYQVSYNNSFGRLSGRRARSASIRQTAPVIVATIVFHSTSATRCGLAITAPPT
nr:fimbrial outer membrane usher protein [Klebsiella pneumoniae]